MNLDYNNYQMTDAGEQYSDIQSLIDWRTFFGPNETANQQIIQPLERNQNENSNILPLQHPVSPILPPQQIARDNTSNSNNPFGLTAQQIEEMDYWISLAFQQNKDIKRKQAKKTKLKTKKIEATSECPICLQNMKKNSRIPSLICRHEFHQKCLNSWMKKKQSCPLCRLDIEHSQV